MASETESHGEGEGARPEAGSVAGPGRDSASSLDARQLLKSLASAAAAATGLDQEAQARNSLRSTSSSGLAGEAGSESGTQHPLLPGAKLPPPRPVRGRAGAY